MATKRCPYSQNACTFSSYRFKISKVVVVKKVNAVILLFKGTAFLEDLLIVVLLGDMNIILITSLII